MHDKQEDINMKLSFVTYNFDFIFYLLTKE